MKLTITEATSSIRRKSQEEEVLRSLYELQNLRQYQDIVPTLYKRSIQHLVKQLEDSLSAQQDILG